MVFHRLRLCCPRGDRRFSFKTPEPHFAPSSDINYGSSAQNNPNSYLDSILANRPLVPCQPLCTRTSHSNLQFMAWPRQEVPLQFLVERGVIGGLIPVASNSLKALSVLGASGSSRAQTVGLLNDVNSACRVTLLPLFHDEYVCLN